MTARSVIRLVWAAAVAAGGLGGCKCGQGMDVGDGAAIEKTPFVVEDPTAPAPTVEFPADVRSDDATLNAFVEHALQVCARGDYDGFRQLFDVAYPPQSLADFERVWHAAKELAVAGLRRGPGEPARYYVHIVVRWREPDRKNRTERDTIVKVFREGGKWRIAPVPKEEDAWRLFPMVKRRAPGTQPLGPP